jgi:ADP-ribose pyrophosphatase YjhB (NUDIX family)
MAHLFADEVNTVTELRDRLVQSGFNETCSIAVESLIFDADNRLLLLRRGASARDEVGKLEGIGGRADESTTLREELFREIAEEIGSDLKIEVLEFLEVKSDRALKVLPDGTEQWGTWVIASYICRLVSGEPRIQEPDKNEGLERIANFAVDPSRLSSSCRQSLQALQREWRRVSELLAR